eukprot:1154418-Pelagomonas_calceolata.AAC.1
MFHYISFICSSFLQPYRYCSDVNDEIPGGCDAVQGSFSAGLVGVRRARFILNLTFKPGTGALVPLGQTEPPFLNNNTPSSDVSDKKQYDEFISIHVSKMRVDKGLACRTDKCFFRPRQLAKTTGKEGIRSCQQGRNYFICDEPLPRKIKALLHVLSADANSANSSGVRNVTSLQAIISIEPRRYLTQLDAREDYSFMPTPLRSDEEQAESKDASFQPRLPEGHPGKDLPPGAFCHETADGSQVVCGVSVVYCCTLPPASMSNFTASESLSAIITHPPPDWRDQWQQRHEAFVSAADGHGQDGDGGDGDSGGENRGAEDQGSSGNGMGSNTRGGNEGGGGVLEGGSIAGIGECREGVETFCCSLIDLRVSLMAIGGPQQCKTVLQIQGLCACFSRF